jgi:hypothetical protein
MSILLKGVDVPKSCADCINQNYFAFVNCNRFLEMGNAITKEKHKDCPLIEVVEDVQQTESQATGKSNEKIS